MSDKRKHHDNQSHHMDRDWIHDHETVSESFNKYRLYIGDKQANQNASLDDRMDIAFCRAAPIGCRGERLVEWTTISQKTEAMITWPAEPVLTTWMAPDRMNL